MLNSRKNPGLNVQINPLLNIQINPRFNGQISPQFNAQLNPRFNALINPACNGQINPMVNEQLNPQINEGLNPQLNAKIDPQLNSHINPRVNPNSDGLFFFDLHNQVTGFSVQAELNTMIAFDLEGVITGICTKFAGGYAVFDWETLEQLNYLISDGQTGFNQFSLDGWWIGHAK